MAPAPTIAPKPRSRSIPTDNHNAAYTLEHVSELNDLRVIDLKGDDVAGAFTWTANVCGDGVVMGFDHGLAATGEHQILPLGGTYQIAVSNLISCQFDVKSPAGISCDAPRSTDNGRCWVSSWGRPTSPGGLGFIALLSALVLGSCLYRRVAMRP